MPDLLDKPIRKEIRYRFYSLLIWAVVSFIARTVRLKVIGEEPVNARGKAGQPSIVVSWHGRTLLPVARYGPRGWAAMISLSGDGEYQSRIFRRFGWQIVRGSSGRGGVRALVGAVRKVREGATFAFTPDGPTGPSHTVHPGVLFLSQKGECPIYPLGVSAQPRWLLPTWDRYLVPRPFSRAVMLYGAPLSIPPAATEEELEEYASILAQRISEVEHKAEEISLALTHSHTRTLMYYLYNTLLLILSPVVMLYAAARDLRRIGWRRLPERFGRLRVTPRSGPRVWIHAASVGETMSAVSIVAALREIRPDVEIVFSNITATGHDTALELLPDAQNIYFPFDFPAAVRRSLKTIQPDVCVMIEKEFWPNFIHLSRQSGARVCLLNGRISDRTYRRASNPLVGAILRWMLSQIDTLAMQTSRDADRARELGARADRVRVVGASKFDQAVAADPPANEVAAEMDIPTHAPILVAGSTHASEDETVLDAFLEVRRVIPNARLIIAPRRLQRVPELREAIARRGLQAQLRTEKDGPPASAPVFILDTIGELRRVYSLGQAAFVGGSLVPVGGHDLLQPLAKGKPVLFGPYTHNCSEIAETVLEAGAGVRIRNAAELAREWIRLLEDPDEARRRGETGLKLIGESRGASARCAEEIVSLLAVKDEG